MSKTVTLQVSDYTAIEIDFFFEMRALNPLNSKDREKLTVIQSLKVDAPASDKIYEGAIATSLCASLSILETSYLGDPAFDRHVKEGNKYLYRAKDKYTLLSRVLECVKSTIEQARTETDPRRIVKDGAALEKFIHASLNLYLEEILDKFNDVLLDGGLV